MKNFSCYSRILRKIFHVCKYNKKEGESIFMKIIKQINLKSNLKELRLKTGMTQEDLSIRCQVSTRTIQNLEKEVNKNIELLYKLKKELNLNSLDDLFSNIE